MSGTGTPCVAGLFTEEGGAKIFGSKCTTCGTRVIGHGVQVNRKIFCSASCGRKMGYTGFYDRIAESPVIQFMPKH